MTEVATSKCLLCRHPHEGDGFCRELIRLGARHSEGGDFAPAAPFGVETISCVCMDRIDKIVPGCRRHDGPRPINVLYDPSYSCGKCREEVEERARREAQAEDELRPAIEAVERKYRVRIHVEDVCAEEEAK